ncbi:hypothetical protein HZA42_03540 [Candidatus Peregrinibacteria bacterium]|nr:hypothetical protein [Candidatus Peregrinibacteria bacterium]
MKKIIVSLGIVAVLFLGYKASSGLVAVLFSDTGWFSKDPQKAVNEGIAKFTEVKKMNSELNMSGTVNAPEGEKPAKTQFKLNASGRIDSSDDKQLKADIKFALDTNIDGATMLGEFLFRTLDKKMYLNLLKLDMSGADGTSLKNELTEVLNKWWSLSVSEEGSIGKIADEQKQLKDALKVAKIFSNATRDVKEDIHGVASTKYRVEVDKEGLKKFVMELARVSGNQLAPEEEIAIADGLKEVEFSGAVWIGDDDDMLHRIRGTITSRPKQGPNSSFEIDYSGWDYGEDVAIIVPEDVKDFNPLMLLPFFGTLNSVSDGGAATSEESGAAAPATPAPAAKPAPKTNK